MGLVELVMGREEHRVVILCVLHLQHHSSAVSMPRRVHCTARMSSLVDNTPPPPHLHTQMSASCVDVLSQRSRFFGSDVRWRRFTGASSNTRLHSRGLCQKQLILGFDQNLRGQFVFQCYLMSERTLSVTKTSFPTSPLSVMASLLGRIFSLLKPGWKTVS